jgi:undecaprenyl phosphate-alpha-L-ara4FN deformylase
MSAITVGLRIDVDTFRGTRDGVPALIDILQRHNVRASFFMSVGPDNMGRNLWRLLKPAFLHKMLRSKAASLYGWDILLRGTAWPGPIIGDRLRAQVRLPFDAGHEMGLHAWDHFSWQAHIDRYSPTILEQHISRGFEKLGEINGTAPTCSAAAGWRCNEATLLEKEKFKFAYNSDCRGDSLFLPVVDGRVLTQQIPVTLPTYDEVIGNPGVNLDNFNEHILQQLRPDQLNVYTIHAEVEGIVLRQQFENLLQLAEARGITFKPLGELITKPVTQKCAWTKEALPGREGWLAHQGEPLQGQLLS